jgi:hypothetical protein
MFVAVCAVSLCLGRPAYANPVNPDLTAFDLDFLFDGISFSAGSPFGSVFSWTTPTGAFGGATLGTFDFNWNGTGGSLSLYDDLSNTQLLGGSVVNFRPSFLAPAGQFGGAFTALVRLTTTGLGFGNLVWVTLGSTNFTTVNTNLAPGQWTGFGTGQADITQAPEPSTLVFAVVGLVGAATVAHRRRRTHQVR